MLRLFLENIEVELNEKIQFALTKQFEDITSPADIKNDYSKTVKIPFSAHNNKLFGNLFSTDRLIVDGDNTLMGVYFNPYKKVDFRLQYGDEVLMVGYAKNISVERVNEREGYYNITLNGELGKVFQEMKKITFDNTTEDKKYLINGGKYIDEVISKDLIYQLWNNEPIYEEGLVENYIYHMDAETGEVIKKPNLGYRLQDYLGFIPNNSYEENFDYKTYEIKTYGEHGEDKGMTNNISKTFAETLDDKAKSKLGDESTYVNATGIEAETIIGEGLLPREIGEYRSYYQLPYIFFNKLFQIFTEKTTEITGYNIELDNSWFNERNPYWCKMVYMLSKFNTKEELTSETDNISNFTLLSTKLRPGTSDVPILYYPYTYSPSTLEEQWVEFTGVEYEKLRTQFRNGEIDVITINQDLPIDIMLTNPRNKNKVEVGTTSDKIFMGAGAHIHIQFALFDENGNRVASYTSYVCGYDYTAENMGAENSTVYKVDGIAIPSNRVIIQRVGGKMKLNIERSLVGNDFSIKMFAKYVVVPTDGEMLSRYIEPIYFLNSLNFNNIVAFDNIKISLPANTKLIYTTTNTFKRSGFRFTLNDLWNNEFNPFDEILNYCKQYRIGVFCDYVNKKLIFKPLSVYFSDYKVLDWTDKVDYSKAYNIQPITFENKYLLFNYEKYETELNRQYNEKYGLNFGEYRLTTDYEFNTEEKELFKFSKVTIPSTDICLSWKNLYDNLSIIYTLPAEITAYNKDKEEKNVNVFGSMLFYKGLKEFDVTSDLRSVTITDDSYLQTLNKTYFYLQGAVEDKSIKTTTYPVLDIVYDNYLNTFAIPQENYTYVKNSYDRKNGVYKNFWENYLNERYNKQNKIVTCYVRLTPQDFAQFEYNNFVKIGNQLYMVNKIYDYQIDENALTKVDLITIQDIKGYTKALTFEIFDLYNSKGQIWDYYRDYITLTKVGQTQTIYATSTEPITWTDENGALQGLLIYYNNDKSNGINGTTGTIPAGENIPITFEMLDNEDEFGDIVFRSNEKEYRVSVALIRDESFSIYDSDKSLWTSTDKIELQNTNPLQKTIYITSPNADVQWSVNDNTLQDLYINGQAGSGVIPSGTLVPVTFVMDKEGDVGAISSSVRFYTNKQTTDVNVKIYYNEIFKVYHWNGDLWDEQYGYIDLSPDSPKQVIYLDANSDVEWVYVDKNGNPSADLQGLGICPNEDGDWDWGSYDWSGRGTIYPPSNYRPIYFGMDSSLVQGRSEGRVEFYNGRHSWYIDVVLRDNN